MRRNNVKKKFWQKTAAFRRKKWMKIKLIKRKKNWTETCCVGYLIQVICKYVYVLLHATNLHAPFAACQPAACLPVLAWPRQLQLRFACMTHAWPSLRSPVHICGFVRQYPQAISCSDCQMRLDQFAAFWPGLVWPGPGLLQYVLVANWESDSAAGIKSSSRYSLQVWQLFALCFADCCLKPQASLATGSHSNLDYVEPIKIIHPTSQQQ